MGFFMNPIFKWFKGKGVDKRERERSSSVLKFLKRHRNIYLIKKKNCGLRRFRDGCVTPNSLDF